MRVIAIQNQWPMDFCSPCFLFFVFSHSIIPVVPVDLLEYTQLPSTYIMGIHSSLREQIDVEMVREGRGGEGRGGEGRGGEGRGGEGREGRREGGRGGRGGSRREGGRGERERERERERESNPIIYSATGL